MNYLKEARVKSVWLLLKHKDTVLLLKRSDKVNAPNLWNLPGGGYEQSDKTPWEGIKREAFEEAGLIIKAKPTKAFSVRVKKKTGGVSKAGVFLYDVIRRPKVTLNVESSTYKWVTVDFALTKLPLHGPTKAALLKAIELGILDGGFANAP